MSICDDVSCAAASGPMPHDFMLEMVSRYGFVEVDGTRLLKGNCLLQIVATHESLHEAPLAASDCDALPRLVERFILANGVCVNVCVFAKIAESDSLLTLAEAKSENIVIGRLPFLKDMERLAVNNAMFEGVRDEHIIRVSRSNGALVCLDCRGVTYADEETRMEWLRDVRAWLGGLCGESMIERRLATGVSVLPVIYPTDEGALIETFESLIEIGAHGIFVRVPTSDPWLRHIVELARASFPTLWIGVYLPGDEHAARLKPFINSGLRLDGVMFDDAGIHRPPEQTAELLRVVAAYQWPGLRFAMLLPESRFDPGAVTDAAKVAMRYVNVACIPARPSCAGVQTEMLLTTAKRSMPSGGSLALVVKATDSGSLVERLIASEALDSVVIDTACEGRLSPQMVALIAMVVRDTSDAKRQHGLA